MDDDFEYRCPFDPSHGVLGPLKFHRHVNKCRESLKKQPGHPCFANVRDLKQCRFDARHFVHKDEIDAHERQTCKQALKYAAYKLEAQMEEEAAAEAPSSQGHPASKVRSEWDTDSEDEAPPPPPQQQQPQRHQLQQEASLQASSPTSATAKPADGGCWSEVVRKGRGVGRGVEQPCRPAGRGFGRGSIGSNQ